MIKIRFLACCLAFLSCAPAMDVAGAREDDSPGNAIARYDIAWAARDKAALENLIAPGFVYFTSKGGEWSRARWLDFMLSPGYRLEAAKRVEVVVHASGNVAVASTRWIGNGSFEGRPFRDDQRCSITLVRDAGTWQIVSEHCTRIQR
nr:nuclear transport factor 2 family protein [Pseudoxanthomonas sp.]